MKNHHQKVISSNGIDITLGNKVNLLQNGQDFFPAVRTALDQARYEIYLETYIFANDTTGQYIASALVRAASRGVKVRVLVDGYGSKDLQKSVLDRLGENGVETCIYRPMISPWTLQRKRLRRMHRKIVVVDREVAFVGGINIVDDKDAASKLAPRFDYAVEVFGPLVDEIRQSVRRLWLEEKRKMSGKKILGVETLPISNFRGGTMCAAFLIRDNFHHRRDIEEEYLRAIALAEAEIYLAHAYFLPGIHFRQALIDVAARGVRVVILVHGRTDHLLEHFASRALFGSFLEAGVEIFEYKKGFLHAKVAVIDRHWATVGSSNIDPFSLLLSLEGNIVVNDKLFGENLAQCLESTLERDCQQIPMLGWKQNHLGFRFICWICYGLLRLMRGVSGFEREIESEADN